MKSSVISITCRNYSLSFHALQNVAIAFAQILKQIGVRLVAFALKKEIINNSNQSNHNAEDTF